MAKETWTLIDRGTSTYLTDPDFTPRLASPMAAGNRVSMRRLRGGPSDGVDIVQVDNGHLRFAVLPTRGMGIWKAWLGDRPIGWNSPVPGPVHPALVPLSDPGGLGWLDGFDELLVRCGLESNGAPEFDAQGRLVYGLHGRIANKPAHLVQLSMDGETGDIELTGVVDEVRFHFFKLRLSTTIRTRAGDNCIEICDRVENLSASPADIQLLYHINVGPPLLEPAARVVAPVKALAPRDAIATPGLDRWDQYATPQPGAAEQVYFFQLHADDQQRAAVLLKNAAGDHALGVEFRTDQLPCFTLWKNEIATPDGFVTGLEPATNFPNYRSFEKQQGRVVALEAGGACCFDLALRVLAGSEQVSQAERRIRELRCGEPTIHAHPRPDWSASP